MRMMRKKGPNAYLSSFPFPFSFPLWYYIPEGCCRNRMGKRMRMMKKNRSYKNVSK